MQRLILLALVLLTSCDQRPVTMAKSSVPGPVSPISVATYPVPEPEKITLVTVPTARVAVGRNIWMEVVKTEEAALASLVGDALNSLGSNLAVGNPLSLPTQPLISWQKRTAGIERRVVMDLEVVLTKGYLEHLISRSEAGKDHESILSNQFDAEILNAALLGSGLVPGKPAKFINEQRELDFKPATGQTVRIYLEYEDADGKKIVVPAQSWVVGGKDSKPLTSDWVYAGSYKGESTTAMGEKFVYFAANDGRVVCLANFGSALLDLPFESVKGDPQGDTLSYRANSAVIPERGTKVRAFFEAVPKK